VGKRDTQSDHGGQVAHRVDAVERVVGGRAVADVRDNKLGFFGDVAGPAVVHRGAERIEAADLVPRRRQRLHHVGSNEPGRPGHQYSHSCEPTTLADAGTRPTGSRHSSVRGVQRPRQRPAASVGAMETAADPATDAVGSPLIDVVLPCLNEAGALPWLLTRMPAWYRPIVADNGSTDGSAEVAAAHGATVVVVPQRGFGA